MSPFGKAILLAIITAVVIDVQTFRKARSKEPAARFDVWELVSKLVTAVGLVVIDELSG